MLSATYYGRYICHTLPLCTTTPESEVLERLDDEETVGFIESEM